MALFNRIKDWGTEVLTDTDLEAEFDNIINNLVPNMIEDWSPDLSTMQTQTDPYPGGIPSQATSLAGELERLRYQIARLSGETYWYLDPAASIKTHASRHGPQGADTIRTYYRSPYLQDATELTTTNSSAPGDTLKTAYMYLDRTSIRDIRNVHVVLGVHVDNSNYTAAASLWLDGVQQGSTFNTTSTAYVYTMWSVDVSGKADGVLTWEIKMAVGNGGTAYCGYTEFYIE